MDKIGLQELIRVGVGSARNRLRQHQSDTSSVDLLEDDPQVVLILDRLTQLGIVLLEHDVHEIWDTLVNGLVEVYRAPLPTVRGYDSVSPHTARILVRIIQRVFTLGAYAVKRQRFELLSTLVLQKPAEDDDYYYWSTHAGTMAARADIEGAFKGRSLIGPASEMLRTKPEFFVLFDDNMDSVVNSMCQFDLFQCLVISHNTRDLHRCYPNFGGYWNQRTLPLVRDLCIGGKARQALNDISNSELANLLVQLDRYAGSEFFRVNGWRPRTWLDPEIIAFIEKYQQKDSQL